VDHTEDLGASLYAGPSAASGPGACAAAEPSQWCLMPGNRSHLFLCEVAVLALRGNPRAVADGCFPHQHLSPPPSRFPYLLEQLNNFARFLQLLLVICCLPPCFSHGVSPMSIV